MKLYLAVVVCSALMLAGMLLVNMDMLLPLYGFEAFRASAGWQFFQLVSVSTALPFLAFLTLLTGITGMIYTHLSANQPTQPGATNQPTNQLTQPDDQPTAPKRLEDNQVSIPLIMIEELPPGVAEQGSRLSEEVKQSVLYYAREGSYKLAAQRLNKNPETIRKNCIKAREVAPDWYNAQVEE
jgi:hypothetical protein